MVLKSTLWTQTKRRMRSGDRMQGTGEAKDADVEADVVVDEASGRKVHPDVSAAGANICSVTVRTGKQ